jgi:hypothetical protein
MVPQVVVLWGWTWGPPDKDASVALSRIVRYMQRQKDLYDIYWLLKTNPNSFVQVDVPEMISIN